MFPINRACKTTSGWQTPAGDDKLTGASDPRPCIERCRAFCLSGARIHSDRPSRRLQATRQAPRRAEPCQDSEPPDCLRKLRQTGSVASFEFRPLRSRPHSATAPFAPNSGAKGLRLRSGLRRAEIHHRQTVSASSDRLALCSLLAWLLFVTACAGPLAGSAIAQPAASPHCAGLSRPRLSVVLVKVRCCLPNQGRWSATEHNAGIMRSAKTALSASPHNLHYV